MKHCGYAHGLVRMLARAGCAGRGAVFRMLGGFGEALFADIKQTKSRRR